MYAYLYWFTEINSFANEFILNYKINSINVVLQLTVIHLYNGFNGKFCFTAFCLCSVWTYRWIKYHSAEICTEVKKETVV